jgi:hypothetical protein
LPLSGLAGSNPASCRVKNTPTPEFNITPVQILDVEILTFLIPIKKKTGE